MSVETIRNWELARTEPALRLWPPLIEFLGFVPFEIGETLGERIRAWRTVNGVARTELADRLGVDESTVWRWESGESSASANNRRQLKATLAFPASSG